jgi:hypothetical protein
MNVKIEPLKVVIVTDKSISASLSHRHTIISVPVLRRETALLNCDLYQNILIDHNELVRIHSQLSSLQ